jgi:hypothetical protein
VTARSDLRTTLAFSIPYEWLMVCVYKGRRRSSRATKAQNEQKGKSFIRFLKMTWRIDRVVGGDNTVALCISGRITQQDLGTLRNAIEEEAAAVAIDLKNVLLVDREVVKFIAQRELNGTALRNCPPYIREWVTKERAETTETSGESEDAGCF